MISHGFLFLLNNFQGGRGSGFSCGPYGSCNINNSPVCSCLKGFVPKIPKEWEMVDWSNGCVRRSPLNCSGVGFRNYSNVKFPETPNYWFNKSMNLKECKIMCMKNCSCSAYTNLDIRDGGSGCLLWFHDLIDIREFDVNGPEWDFILDCIEN